MTASSAVRAGRIAAEARMVDTCTIVAITTSKDIDPATGKAKVTRTIVYAGRCEFKAADTQARSVASGGRQLVQQGAVLKLPVDAPGSADVRAGHEATVTLVTNDPASAPLIAAVSAGHHQTYSTARRIPVEVTSDG